MPGAWPGSAPKRAPPPCRLWPPKRKRRWRRSAPRSRDPHAPQLAFDRAYSPRAQQGRTTPLRGLSRNLASNCRRTKEVGGSQYQNVEEAAASGTDRITVIVPEPFPFADLAPVLQVDERVVQGRGEVDFLIGDVASVVEQIRSHKQTTHQDCQDRYNGQAYRMLHCGECPGLGAHAVMNNLAPASYRRSVRLLPTLFTMLLLSSSPSSKTHLGLLSLLLLPEPRVFRDGEVEA